jgi:hypothetical protein
MREAWIRHIQCPTGAGRSWVVVSYREGGEVSVRAFATRARAMDAMSHDDSAFEAFLRPIERPSPTGWVLMWRGDDFLDVHIRAFASRSRAMFELADLLDADASDPEAAQDAAKLRLLATES